LRRGKLPHFRFVENENCLDLVAFFKKARKNCKAQKNLPDGTGSLPRERQRNREDAFFRAMTIMSGECSGPSAAADVVADGAERPSPAGGERFVEGPVWRDFCNAKMCHDFVIATESHAPLASLRQGLRCSNVLGAGKRKKPAAWGELS
jgi:hypothetical protein